ncbi:MAG: hypothetical protein HKN14_02485 [Marinicaulis sp.]|nr:FecR domain-containing protein [Marinicaulis sp.]NNE39767.1 hypothetical protein [Marinicaulis sp.]
MNTTSWHNLSKTAQDDALEWHAKLSVGDLSDVEYEAFSSWIADSIENATAYSLVESADNKISAVVADDTESLDRLLPGKASSDSQSPTNDNMLTRRRAIAASIAGLAFVSIAVFANRQFTPDVEQFALAAASDEFRTANLSDGSIVNLAPGAELTVEFNGNRRRITSLTGVAFFDVASNAKRPFIIEIDKTIVTVVGTEFEIAAFEDRHTVSVAEGVVSVRRNDAAQPMETRLAVGEQIEFSTTEKNSLISNTSPESIGAWRAGYFEFTDADAQTITTTLNRFYGKRVFIIDPQNPPTFSFSGVLTLSDSAGTAQRLGQLTAVELSLNDEAYLLSAK